MAEKLDALPPIDYKGPNGRGGGKVAPWPQWADGEVWKLNLLGDLNYPMPGPEELKTDAGRERALKSQTRALSAVRQWARNNGYVPIARRQGFTEIVISLHDDPNNVAGRENRARGRGVSVPKPSQAAPNTSVKPEPIVTPGGSPVGTYTADSVEPDLDNPGPRGAEVRKPAPVSQPAAMPPSPFTASPFGDLTGKS